MQQKQGDLLSCSNVEYFEGGHFLAQNKDSELEKPPSPALIWERGPSSATAAVLKAEINSQTSTVSAASQVTAIACGLEK